MIQKSLEVVKEGVKLLSNTIWHNTFFEKVTITPKDFMTALTEVIEYCENKKLSFDSMVQHHEAEVKQLQEENKKLREIYPCSKAQHINKMIDQVKKGKQNEG